MTKGYVVVIEDVYDEEKLAAYTEAATPAIIESKARVMAFDSKPTIVEGRASGQRVVILEFESVQAARQWYNSPAYQAAIPLRQAAADSMVMIVSGVPTASSGRR